MCAAEPVPPLVTMGQQGVKIAHVPLAPPKTYSEDFSILAERAPGAFMFLGAEITDYQRCHHAADFDVNESGLYIGPAVLVATALRLLVQ
jgi:metal-dependent amidase/aminoacylase/carboxypeptidase family protein